MATSFALMDTDTFNMVGSFRSHAAALRAVAETARRYGTDSAEARSLVLFRQDGAADQAYVAEGDELVRLALAVGAQEKGDNTARAGTLVGSARPKSRAPATGERVS